MMKYKKLIYAGLALIGSLHSTAYADAILHAFNWKYSDITNRAKDIANAGYKKVLISPAMKTSGNEWWARYQPQDLRVIDSPIGNKEDLQKMISTLQGVGVDVYADVVLNHMANESWKRSDLDYPGKDVLLKYSENMPYFENQKLFGDLNNNLFSKYDFHSIGCISNWSDPGHVQYWRLCGSEGDLGLPDLDPNSWVISQQKLYLHALKEMGIKGFRIDAVKHMSMYQVNQLFSDDITKNMHIFGEVITSGGKGDSSYETFLSPYLNDTEFSAYDFPLFATIRSAFSMNGGLNELHDPLAYGQALDNSRSITFTITHDIPTNDGFRYQIMDPTDEQLAYVYILGKDGGSPLIYSDHLLNYEDRDNGRWSNVWNSKAMISMLSFHNKMQGKTMDIIHSDKCTLLFKRGKSGIVAINKCNENKKIYIDTKRFELDWYKEYKDILSGKSITIDSDIFKITIPSRQANMYIRQ
ncbi:TPA: alpha-amylase family glycosyl hydrolase [Photobacterium damselae]